MAERYNSLDLQCFFKVTCDSCNLERLYRTEKGANLAADTHEIDFPMHNVDVAIQDTKAPGA